MTSNTAAEEAMPRRLALIPARGGSKRILEKNIRQFRGQPIIGYTLQAASASRLFHTIHVSTDSERVAAVAAGFGFPVPFLRPPQLADEHTPIMPVARYVVERFSAQGLGFDEVWILMACAPLLMMDDLIGAANLYAEAGARSPVLAVGRYPAPIEWAFELSEAGQLTPVEPGLFAVRSQDLRPKYYDAGMFSVFPAATVLRSQGAGDDTSFLGYVIPPQRVTDIDNEDDWRLAEALFDALNTARTDKR